MSFAELFGTKLKPVIACVHLLPLLGAPKYDGDMGSVYERALSETDIFMQHGIDGLIVENFHDKPFFPSKVPAETIAALAAVTRDIRKSCKLPVGVNVLRSDGEAAIAVATAVEADFVRINVHMGAIVSEQGIIQGQSHNTLRLRAGLKSKALIFADVGVKHAAPLADRGLAMEAKDMVERGLADALIVSGELTGSETKADDVETVRKTTSCPILIGSGATPDNLHKVWHNTNGFIVGSYFKTDGKAGNQVEPQRVAAFMAKVKALRSSEAA